MKRTWFLLTAAWLVACTVVTCAAAQQSLGELARQQRQAKRPSSARVITNDDIDIALAPAPEATAAVKDDKSNKDEKSSRSDAAKAPSADDKEKLAATFKAKAEEQKKAIAQLERELDVARREYRLKVAVYYADVGNNLRDSKKWAEEDRKQRAELDDKQKALAEAKQKLADIQEEARKAGVRVE